MLIDLQNIFICMQDCDKKRRTNIKLNSFRINNIISRQRVSNNSHICVGFYHVHIVYFHMAFNRWKRWHILNSIHFSKYYCNLCCNLIITVIQPNNINKKWSFASEPERKKEKERARKRHFPNKFSKFIPHFISYNKSINFDVK